MSSTLLPLFSSLTLFAVSTAVAQDDANLPAEAEETTAAGILPIPEYAGDVGERSVLTGDWDGGRTRLAEQGIQFQFEWVQYVQGITSGGLERATRYGGVGDYVITFDLDRMGVVPGGLVTFRGESRYGKSVNEQVGTVLPVNTNAFFPLTDEPDEAVPFTIIDLYYTQFLSEHFGVFLGKLNTLNGDSNEFAGGRGSSQFMNANLVFNSALALRLPYSTLGVGAAWLPTDRFSITANLFNTVDSSTSTGFNDFGDGVSATLEAQFQYELGDLPGGMAVGGLYSFNQDFNQIDGRLLLVPGEGLARPTEDSTWTAFWNGWQYLWADGGDGSPIRVADGRADLRGLGVFGRLGFADRRTNPIEFTVNLGLGGRGLIPSRDEDTFGVGWFFNSIQTTRFTDPLGVADRSQGIEAWYDIAITPAMNLTLDAQFVDGPYTGADTAIVLGARLGVEF